MVNVLKASAKSNPGSIAGAIASRVKAHGAVEVDCIGAASLNNAIKAVAIASGFVAPYGVELICKPAFYDTTIDGEERTGIKLIVEPR